MANSSDVVAGTDIFASDHNNLRKDLMLGARLAETKAGAAIVTLDLSDVSKGNIKTVNLDQNVTVRFSGITAYPTLFFIRFVQNSTGGFSATIDQTGMHYPGGSQAPVAQGANERTSFMVVCNGVNDFDCYYAGFGLKAV